MFPPQDKQTLHLNVPHTKLYFRSRDEDPEAQCRYDCDHEKGWAGLFGVPIRFDHQPAESVTRNLRPARNESECASFSDPFSKPVPQAGINLPAPFSWSS